MSIQLAALTLASIIHRIAFTNATHDFSTIVAIRTAAAATLLGAISLAIALAHGLDVNLGSLTNTLCTYVENDRFERTIGQSLRTFGELDFDREIDLLFDFQSVARTRFHQCVAKHTFQYIY